MRVKSKCKNENKKKNTQSAQSAWSARSAVCSLHGLRFGVTLVTGGRKEFCTDEIQILQRCRSSHALFWSAILSLLLIILNSKQIFFKRLSYCSLPRCKGYLTFLFYVAVLYFTIQSDDRY